MDSVCKDLIMDLIILCYCFSHGKITLMHNLSCINWHISIMLCLCTVNIQILLLVHREVPEKTQRDCCTSVGHSCITQSTSVRAQKHVSMLTQGLKEPLYNNIQLQDFLEAYEKRTLYNQEEETERGGHTCNTALRDCIVHNIHCGFDSKWVHLKMTPPRGPKTITRRRFHCLIATCTASVCSVSKCVCLCVCTRVIKSLHTEQ